MSKYRAVRTNGFASKREANRAAELAMLERAGVISNLRTQVKYELIPKQTGERSCTYTADFVYEDQDGQTHVVDAKGIRTQQYVIRRKLMLWVHGIRIEEI